MLKRIATRLFSTSRTVEVAAGILAAMCVASLLIPFLIVRYADAPRTQAVAPPPLVANQAQFNELDMQSTLVAVLTGGTVASWDPTGGSGNLGGVFRIQVSATSATTVNGMIAGTPGQVVSIRNAGANTVTFANAAGSPATQGFLMPNAGSYEVGPGAAFEVRYSPLTLRWTPTSSAVQGKALTANAVCVASDTNQITNSQTMTDGSAGLTVESTNGSATSQSALFSTTRISGTDGNNLCIGTGCPALSFNATVGVHSASDVTALGTGAAQAFGSGADATAIGAFALNAAAGSQATQITAVGASAMINANGAIGFDTAVGQGALENITSGDNTALGQAAMLQQTSGGSNTAVGVQALEGGAGATCMLDVAVGLASNQLCTTGTANTAVGYQSMANATSASSTVAVGYNAMGSGAFTGNRNTCVGVSCMAPITTGYGNAAFGNQAGVGVTTGSQNTFVGPINASFVGTGNGIVTGSFNTVLGSCTGMSDTSGFVYICDGSNTPRFTADSSGNVTSMGGPKNKGTVVSGGTATVTAGAVCTCADTGAATACAVSLSSTTLTVTGTAAHNYNYLCF